MEREREKRRGKERREKQPSILFSAKEKKIDNGY